MSNDFKKFFKSLERQAKKNPLLEDQSKGPGGKRRLTNEDVERSQKGIGTSKVVVDQPSRYVRMNIVNPGRWSAARNDLVRDFHKDTGIPVDVLKDQYFRLDVIEVKALCHLLGGKGKPYSEKRLLNKCSVVYLAQDKQSTPELDLIRMFRHYDKKGAPIENTGIPAVKINMKLFQFCAVIHKRRKIR